MSYLNELKKAKAFSDVRQYEQKHLIMRGLLESHPDDFVVESPDSPIVGLTHIPTGFQMHLPRQVLQGLLLNEKSSGFSIIPVVKADRGLAKFKGGGKGSYKKMPSLASQMKSDLTNATKQIGEDAKEKTPWEKAFPATANYYRNKSKQAALSSDLPKYLGYSPGVWYSDADSVSGVDRMRFGNVVTGLGLTGIGLASIPLLKYLFPERFENKDTALSIAAIVSGLATPWIVNFPHTARELNMLGQKPNNEWTAENSDKFRNSFREKTYSLAKTRNTLKSSSNETSTAAVKEAFLPLGTPISKTHLADVAAEQFQSGFIDYGQAAGLMLAAQQTGSKPWFTVGDLAKTAIGAGVGAVAGTAAAKGIGLFMNMSPTEQAVMQGTGAALGTLINLGKFGI